MTNTVRWRGQFEDRVSGPLDKIRDKFDRIAKNKGASSVLQGVGLGIGVSAYNAVGTAISKASDFLFDSIAAAREAEISNLRLATSLKANVKGWDGNTKAIDEAIRARQKLAFDDEALQDSLTILLGATGDVTQALKVQAVAMDLARFKGIDLQTASEALIKVEAGVFRSLKSLGIELRDGATQTEALAAVQRVASGQARAFGESNAGAAERANVAWENLQETLGGKILPQVTELTDAFTSVTESVTDFVAEVDGSGGLNDALGEFEQVVSSSFRPDKVIDFASQAHIHMGRFLGIIDESDLAVGKLAGRMRSSFDAGGDDAERWGKRVQTSLTAVVDAFETAKTKLTTIGRQAADAIYGPMITAGEIAANEREQTEQRQIIASKDSTKAQVADAKQRLLELQAARLSLMGEAVAHSGALSKDSNAFMAELQKQWNAAVGQQKKRLQELMRQLVLLRLSALAASGALKAASGIGTGTGGRQSGGPVWGGVWDVGEGGHAEKLFLSPGSRGFVVPTSGGGGGHSGIGGGMVAFTYAPTFSSASPAEAQRFSESVVPGLVRELRRQRLV